MGRMGESGAGVVSWYGLDNHSTNNYPRASKFSNSDRLIVSCEKRKKKKKVIQLKKKMKLERSPIKQVTVFS